MKVHYYPGCTLKEKAINLEDSTLAAMEILGVEMVEPENWTCCGAEFPLSEEKIAGLAAPARILRQVEIEGGNKVVTTCAFCFNVLKRTNEALLKDPLKNKRINAFLKDDIKIEPLTKEKTTDFEEYTGHVWVLHLIEYLKNALIRLFFRGSFSSASLVRFNTLKQKAQVVITLLPPSIST